MIFDAAGAVVCQRPEGAPPDLPRPGWVEHDALEIWANVEEVVAAALARLGLGPADLAAVGITNQRETTRPLGDGQRPADRQRHRLAGHAHGRPWSTNSAREGGQDRFRALTGLPLATYFSGPKIRWLLDHVDGARAAAERGEVLFGTIDSWLIWKLTGRHVTDVTNASRTMLMNLATLDWDEALLEAIGVPRAMLPEIRSSAEVYGEARGVLAGVPVASALGDQQAALFGQTCFSPGEGKCTYGTGNFLLVNTGERPVASKHGLAHDRRLSDRRGAGGLCPGRLGRRHRRAGPMAARQSRIHLDRRRDRGPGRERARQRRLLFRAGLLGTLRAPLARRRARRHRRPHRLRHQAATSPARRWKPSPGRRAKWSTPWPPTPAAPLTSLKVDGGMTANNLLMQFQADVLDVPVVRPGDRRNDLPGRRLRRRPGGRLLAGPGDLARASGGRTRSGARPWSRRRREARIRPVEEGGEPNPRLGFLALAPGISDTVPQRKGGWI